MSNAVITHACELNWTNYRPGDVVDETMQHDVAHQLVTLGFAAWEGELEATDVSAESSETPPTVGDPVPDQVDAVDGPSDAGGITEPESTNRRRNKPKEQ